MNKRATLVIGIVSGIVLSFAVGLAAGFHAGARNLEIALGMSVGRMLVEEANQLERVYYDRVERSRKVAALEHFARFLEEVGYAAIPLIGEHAYQRDLALAYIRIGLLLKKDGKVEKSKDYFKKATQVDTNISVDELIDVVEKIDRAKSSRDNSK